MTRALGEGRRSLQVGTGGPSNLETQSAREPPHRGELVPVSQFGQQRPTQLGHHPRDEERHQGGSRAPGGSARRAVSSRPRSQKPTRSRRARRQGWGSRERPGACIPPALVEAPHWLCCNVSDSHTLVMPQGELKSPRLSFSGFKHQAFQIHFQFSILCAECPSSTSGYQVQQGCSETSSRTPVLQHTGVPARGSADRPDGRPAAAQTEMQMLRKQSICIFPEFSKQQTARGQPLARKVFLGPVLFLPLSVSLTSPPPAPGDTNVTKSGSGYARLWERPGAGARRLPGWGQRR